MNIAISTLKMFIARLVGTVASFGAVIIFSQKLGASSLGTYYPFIALVGILGIPADLGIRGAAEKRISEGKDKNEYFGTAIALKIPPLLFLAIVILLLRKYIEQFLGADLAVPLIIALFLNEAAMFGLIVLRGELRVGETAFVSVLRPFSWLVVGYLLYVLGFGVHGLIWGYIVGAVATTIVGWLKISTRPSRPSLKHARSLIDYGQYSFISGIGGSFYSWMDVAILTAFVAAEITSSRAAIGAYENAWRISMLVLVFSRVVAKTLFPQISQWDTEGATHRIESVIPTAILLGLLIVIPAFVGTVVLAKDLLGILFGPEFTVAWLALIILTGEKIFQSVHIVLGRSLQAIDRPDLAAYAAVVAIAINFVLNLVLIWQFGIVGAAIATTASFIVNTILHARYLNQFLEIKLPLREAAWSVVASIAMGTIVYTIRVVNQINTIIELLLVILFGVFIYSLFILSYYPLRTTIWQITKPILPNQILESISR